MCARKVPAQAQDSTSTPSRARAGQKAPSKASALPEKPQKGASKPSPSEVSARRSAAQKGNSNNLQSGLYSEKEQMKRRKQRFRKKARDEIKAILEELNLSDSALAGRLGRRMVQTEVEIAILDRYVERRGRFDKHGEPKKSYTQLLDLQKVDRENIRKILDEYKTAFATRDPGGDVVYTATFADGTPISDPYDPDQPPKYTPNLDTETIPSTRPEPKAKEPKKSEAKTKEKAPPKPRPRKPLAPRPGEVLAGR